jgi:hypothetical protein
MLATNSCIYNTAPPPTLVTTTVIIVVIIVIIIINIFQCEITLHVAQTVNTEQLQHYTS